MTKAKDTVALFEVVDASAELLDNTGEVTAAASTDVRDAKMNMLPVGRIYRHGFSLDKEGAIRNGWDRDVPYPNLGLSGNDDGFHDEGRKWVV